jgi:N-acetylmuramoyl-L-alanine amidase
MLKIKECSIAVFAALVLSIFCLNSLAQAPKKIRTIIVDAGHGGKDKGSHGEYEGTLGSLEKNITLAISLKLVAELKKQLPGAQIIPTRTTDIYHSPWEKARIANNNHGDLFICIHADAVALKTGSRIIGYKTQTYTTTRFVGKGKKKKKIVTPHQREVAIKQYYKIPTSRKGTSTLIFAANKTNDKIKAMQDSENLFQTENNDSSLNINYESPEWKAQALLYTQNYFKRSYKLGSLIQDEIGIMGRGNLGVWQREKGIRVLSATQMPAVLIETGFIANPDDERYLNSEKGQQEIAEAITKAIIKYKDQVENPKPINQAGETTSNQ